MHGWNKVHSQFQPEIARRIFSISTELLSSKKFPTTLSSSPTRHSQPLLTFVYKKQKCNLCNRNLSHFFALRPRSSHTPFLATNLHHAAGIVFCGWVKYNYRNCFSVSLSTSLFRSLFLLFPFMNVAEHVRKTFYYVLFYLVLPWGNRNDMMKICWGKNTKWQCQPSNDKHFWN